MEVDCLPAIFLLEGRSFPQKNPKQRLGLGFSSPPLQPCYLFFLCEWLESWLTVGCCKVSPKSRQEDGRRSREDMSTRGSDLAPERTVFSVLTTEISQWGGLWWITAQVRS
jgi:hypothetical protein